MEIKLPSGLKLTNSPDRPFTYRTPFGGGHLDVMKAEHLGFYWGLSGSPGLNDCGYATTIEEALKNIDEALQKNLSLLASHYGFKLVPFNQEVPAPAEKAISTETRVLPDSSRDKPWSIRRLFKKDN